MEIKPEPCRVCGQNDWTLWDRKARVAYYRWDRKARYSYYRCVRCGADTFVDERESKGEGDEDAVVQAR